MKKPVFTGAGVAIVTPFQDGKVNFPKLFELIDYQIAQGIDSIILCGTTGESATITTEDHLEVLEKGIAYINGRCTAIAGTGSNDTAHAIEMSTAAASYGADALLMVTPYYNKCTQKGLVRHYCTVADAAGVPVIVYNVPSRTGVNMTLETYRELSKHPLMNGVKEASSNIALVARTIAACGDDFHVWSGNDNEIVPIMSLGGKGIISVLANICPSETVAIAKYCLEGDYTAAAKLQLDYLELIDALFCEVNPIPVKTAMNLLGWQVGDLRMPLCEMEPQHLQLLKDAMARAGIPAQM